LSPFTLSVSKGELVEGSLSWFDWLTTSGVTGLSPFTLSVSKGEIVEG